MKRTRNKKSRGSRYGRHRFFMSVSGRPAVELSLKPLLYGQWVSKGWTKKLLFRHLDCNVSTHPQIALKTSFPEIWLEDEAKEKQYVVYWTYCRYVRWGVLGTPEYVENY